jgi:pullulanase/glycogen debranching enzyme
MLALRRVARPEPGGPASATLLLINGYSEDHEFILPEPRLDWQLLADAAEPVDEHGKPQPRSVQDNRIIVAAHAAVLLGVRPIDESAGNDGEAT